MNHLPLSRNYYEILEVAPTADLKTLKKAFHRLSKILHPDTTLLPIDEAAKKFREVCEAYESLCDPISRELYDNFLRREMLKTNNSFTQAEPTQKIVVNRVSNLDHRRSLSGGELLSLLLLCTALIISLFLGIGFALLDGKELQVQPSWLISNTTIINHFPPLIRDVQSTTS